VLSYYINGSEQQSRLLCKQYEQMVSKVNSSTSFAKELLNIHDAYIALDGNVSKLNLDEKFWHLYAKSVDRSLASLKHSPYNFKSLHKPMKELIEYSSGLLQRNSGGSDGAEQKKYSRVEDEMKKLIESFSEILIAEQDATWPHSNNSESCEQMKINENLSRWKHATVKDWHFIVNSILIMKYSRHFCENFGKTITDLSWVLDTLSQSPVARSEKQTANKEEEETRRKCHSCRRRFYGRATLCEICEAKLPRRIGQRDLYHVEVPDHASDSRHWGHLVWMYCNWMEARE